MKTFDISDYRRDFLAGLFEPLLLVAGALFASRRFADVLWKSFRNADNTRSFGRNDIVYLTLFAFTWNQENSKWILILYHNENERCALMESSNALESSKIKAVKDERKHSGIHLANI